MCVGIGSFMSKINLLDCTLRDGGYLNDWEFGQDNIINIFERLVFVCGMFTFIMLSFTTGGTSF